MPYRVLVQRRHFVVGHAGPLVVNVSVAPPTVPDVDDCERAYRSVIQAFGRISVVVIIRPETNEQPPAEVRARLTLLSRRLKAQTVGHATVVEGQGVAPALVRAFLSASRLFRAADEAPSEVFAHHREALDWLAHLPGQTGQFGPLRLELEDEFAKRRFA